MDIFPLGHSSFRIKGKNAVVVTDPFDPKMLGIKFPKIEGFNVVTVSHPHADHNFLEGLGVTAGSREPFVISGPGEYEIAGVRILGVASYHDDKQGAERGNNTIYTISMDEIHLCHLGDLGQKLTDEQLDLISDVDVLFIPVGGHYTIDAKLAAEVVAQVEPSIVIPMHYLRPGMPEAMHVLEPVDKFIKEMGAEGVVAQPKLSISKDKLPETTTVVVLE